MTEFLDATGGSGPAYFEATERGRTSRSRFIISGQPATAEPRPGSRAVARRSRPGHNETPGGGAYRGGPAGGPVPYAAPATRHLTDRRA
jgi:hypothetical protein